MIAYDPDTHFARIGDTTQVFLNDDMLLWVQNVKRTFHKAKPHEANPVLVKDRPWEEMPYFTTCYSVIRDDDGTFKLWYSDFLVSPPCERPMPFFNPPAWSSRMCYAVSHDGVAFDKPSLGQVEIDGEDSNVINWNEDVDVGVAYSVIRDPTETDPSRRLKMTYLPVRLNGNVPKRSTVANPDEVGLSLAFSFDGRSWTPYKDNPVELVWGSDVQMLSFDPDLERYVIYGRCHYAAESGNPRDAQWFTRYYPDQPSGWVPKRTVYRIESEDLVSWSEAKRVLTPERYHNLDDQFYGLPTFRVGDYRCGLLPVLHGVDNTVDSEFVYSQDGIEWNHFPTAGPLIDRGGEGSWDEFMITTAAPPIPVGDKLYIYYGGAASHHDWWAFSGGELDTPETEPGYKVKHGLGLATIRKDGFVSLDAGLREGAVCTKPFFSRGAKLVINGRCDPGGYILAAILDIFETPWEGFEQENCVPFSGDDVDHAFAWKGGHDINMIPGYIRVRFILKHAQLFSFRISGSA